MKDIKYLRVKVDSGVENEMSMPSSVPWLLPLVPPVHPVQTHDSVVLCWQALESRNLVLGQNLPVVFLSMAHPLSTW